MRKRGVLAIFAFFAAFCAPAAVAQQSEGLTPFSVDLLRSNDEEETISALSWRDGSVPVYLLPGEGGDPVPFVRLEADLKHRDWAIFWNNTLVRSAQSTDSVFALEVPLQGEYTQVELFGTRNVVQLEREVLVLHFPKWKESKLAVNLMQKRDDEIPSGRLGTRFVAAAGPELLTQGEAASTAVSLQIQGHSGVGASGRFRLGAQAWLTGAVISTTNTTESFRRFAIEPFLGYVFGWKTRISLFAGASVLTLSASKSLIGLTLTGAVAMPSFQFLLGRGFEISLTPRVAHYSGVPEDMDPPLELGGQLQLKLGARERGGLSILADVRTLDTGAPEKMLTIFGGLGYSL